MSSIGNPRTGGSPATPRSLHKRSSKSPARNRRLAASSLAPMRFRLQSRRSPTSGRRSTRIGSSRRRSLLTSCPLRRNADAYRFASCEVRSHLVSELCQIPPQTPGKHRELRGHPMHIAVGEVVGGNCVSAFRCASARASGVNFQACFFIARTSVPVNAPGRSASTGGTVARNATVQETATHHAPALGLLSHEMELAGGASAAIIPVHGRAVEKSRRG